MATNGLVLIKPSSVAKTGASSTATINAGGSVTFDLCDTLSLNGVFSSAYDNYIVDIWHLGSHSYNSWFRMRSSGTDDTGSNYTRQLLQANNTTVNGTRATETFGLYGTISSTQRSGFQLFFYGPNLAQPTACRSVTAMGLNSGQIADYAVTHSLSVAYDGFTLGDTANFAATFSGLVKVYGLVK